MLIISVNYPLNPRRDLLNYWPFATNKLYMSCPYLGFINQQETNMKQQSTGGSGNHLSKKESICLASHADCTQALELDGCCWNQIFLKGEKEQVCATMFEDKHVLYMSEQLFLPVWWVTEKRLNDGNDSNHFYPTLLLVFVQDSLLTTTCVIHLCTRVDCKIVSLLVQLFLEPF